MYIKKIPILLAQVDPFFFFPLFKARRACKFCIIIYG